MFSIPFFFMLLLLFFLFFSPKEAHAGLHPIFPGNPGQKWQWTVKIDGFEAAWFEGCTFPSKQLDKDTFNPAGSVRGTNFAGRAVLGDVTLKKGKKADSADSAAYAWLKKACDTQAGDLGDPADYKRDIDIIRVDRKGTSVEVYACKGAWVQNVELEDGDGSSSDHQIETITIVIDDYEVE
jgi:phage tail-like protein